MEILYQNIAPEHHVIFDKKDSDNRGMPYDYQSIMHYSQYVSIINCH